jgi:putative addiction module component (TIGR02574 family)
MNAKAILKAARDLPIRERVALVQDIWNTIAEQPDQLELTAAERRLLNERIADDRRHPERAVSWAAARRHIRQRVEAAKTGQKR